MCFYDEFKNLELYLICYDLKGPNKSRKRRYYKKIQCAFIHRIYVYQLRTRKE